MTARRFLVAVAALGPWIVLTGSLDSSGAGLAHLPSEASTMADAPSVSCYIAETTSSDVWLVVATSRSTGACGIVSDGDHLDAGVVEFAPGWAFRIVAVY